MKKKMLFCLFLLLGLCAFSSYAAAQTADVYWSDAGDVGENTPYARDERVYERDFVTPEIAGAARYLYKQSKDVNYYLFSVSLREGSKPVLYLNVPSEEPLTTAYLNGQPLSRETPVEIDLSEYAELHVATKSKRALIRLCFSNLPILSITTPDLISKKEQNGTLTFVDPDYAIHGSGEMSRTFDIMVSYRGNSSTNYTEKRSYNFSLMKDGEKWDQRLLDLRKDSDWLLDAAFNDASRMRNRVCMDVWNDICKLPWNYTLSGATQGRFVEVLVNGNYRGLFVLGEKQDRKQLGLKKADSETKGTIIRSTNTFGQDGFSPAGFHTLGTKLPGAVDRLLWYNLEIKFPDRAHYAEDSWAAMYAFTKLVIKGSKADFAENISDYVYLHNLADYYLFNNAMDLTDNMRKNLTFAQYDKNSARFSPFILVPWDMDASLGRAYSSNKTRVEEKSSNKLFNRLLNENVLDFKTLVYERWQELKNDQLSVDHIMAYFEDYYATISAAGAVKRETERHPTFKSYLEAGYGFSLDIEKELTYIRSYMEKHLAYWDTQIEKLKPTAE